MLWLLEEGIYGDEHPLLHVVRRAGDNVIHGSLFKGARDVEGPVMFHGSLNTALELRGHLRGSPGVLCNVTDHTFTNTQRQLGSLLLNHDAKLMTVKDLVDRQHGVAETLDAAEVFVRPDSPLKQFSGRVVKLDSHLSWADLDFGFYYEDPLLPIVVSPAKIVKREWRFVVCLLGDKRQLVDGCQYDATTRGKMKRGIIPAGVLDVASRATQQLSMSDAAYMLDVCETDAGYFVVETNPFSGSDIYGCRTDYIVSILSDMCDGLYADARARSRY